MKKLMVLALLLFTGATAQADIITELGAGYKLPATTSLLMQEKCHVVKPQPGGYPSMVTKPYDPEVGWFDDIACGGDNPVFVGWPIAWEKDLGVWTVRAGYFHLSHWFDGGSDRELHMDCACASVKFNWTEWKRARAKRVK